MFLKGLIQDHLFIKIKRSENNTMGLINKNIKVSVFIGGVVTTVIVNFDFVSDEVFINEVIEDDIDIKCILSEAEDAMLLQRLYTWLKNQGL